MSVEASRTNPSLPTSTENSHLALARCRDAFEQELSSLHPGASGQLAARLRAAKAYKYALPPLVGPANIRDFIACIAQGILLGAIEETQSSRLLYAARGAQSALRNSTATERLTPPKPE